MASTDKPTWFLIADDYPVMRLGFKELLRATYPMAQFAEAANAPEAIEQAARQPWDLVLIDLYLPDRSAVDLLHDLSLANSHCPILLFTTPQDGGCAIRALKSGCQGVVSKTAPVSEVRQAIK